MGLFTFLILLAILAFSLHISYINGAVVTLYLSRTFSINVSVTILILSSVLIGVVLILLTDGYKRVTGYIQTLLDSQKKRSEERYEELYNKGYSIYLGGKRNEAAKILTKLLSKSPHHISALNLLGKIKREDNNVEEAIKYHSRGKRVEPNNTEILYNLFEDFIVEEKFGDALAVTKELSSLNQRNPRPLEKMRVIYIKKGEWDKAIDVQQQLISLKKGTTEHQKEVDTLLNLKYKRGLDHIKIGEYKKGLSSMRELLKDIPNFVPAYIAIGNAYIATERVKDAVKTWETGYKTTKDSIILKSLTDLYQLSGDDQATIDAYKWAISINPNSSHLHLMLAEFYIRKERGEEGLAELEVAQKELSSHTSLHLLMSIGYKITGKEEESAKACHLAFKAGVKELTRYRCSNCKHEQGEWVDKCPSCAGYNTMQGYPV